MNILQIQGNYGPIQVRIPHDWYNGYISVNNMEEIVLVDNPWSYYIIVHSVWVASSKTGLFKLKCGANDMITFYISRENETIQLINNAPFGFMVPYPGEPLKLRNETGSTALVVWGAIVSWGI